MKTFFLSVIINNEETRLMYNYFVCDYFFVKPDGNHNFEFIYY